MGWSGGVFTRVRNWVTDKSNSINPQAALFDSEDDNFAAGLNNCVTKDGLNKPSSAMDWNGQNLTGVLNFANSGTVSLVGGKWTISLAGNLVGAAPTSGNAMALTGFAGGSVANLNSGSASNASVADVNISRAGSTANTIQQGPNLVLNDTANSTNSSLQHSGGQTELWQFNGSWIQQWRVTSTGIMQARDQGGTLQDLGWRDCPQTLTSVNYTAVLSDRGKLIFTGSAGITFTIPSNASVPYPIGTVLSFATLGGAATISINTDTMFLAGTATSGSRTLANSGLATAIKVTSTSWLISGSGLS